MTALRRDIRSSVLWRLAKLGAVAIVVTIPTPNIGGVIAGFIWRSYRLICWLGIDGHGQLFGHGLNGFHDVLFEIIIGLLDPLF